MGTGFRIVNLFTEDHAFVTGQRSVEIVEDLYYQELFRKIASSYIPCLLDPPAADPLPKGALLGKAANYIKKNLTPAGYDFYICGDRELTREVTLLADEQFPGSYVYTEVYF